MGIAVFALTLPGAACSLLVPSEAELMGGSREDASGPADGGALSDVVGASDGDDVNVVSDAQSDAPVDAGGDDASSVVTYQWDFSSGCAGWAPNAGTMLSREETLVRSAPGACRACPADGNSIVEVLHSGVPQGFVVDGGQLAKLEVFARAVTASTGLRVNIYTGTVSHEAFGTAGASFSSTTAEGPIQADSTFFLSTSAKGVCVIFDDATLRQDKAK